MQHYNSSISQSFMVMSFVAAGLLLSVQLTGDRSSNDRKMATRGVVPPASVANRTILRRIGSTRYIPPKITTQNLSDAVLASKAVLNAPQHQADASQLNLSPSQWEHSVQASLSPIGFINALIASPNLLAMPKPDKGSVAASNAKGQINSETGELISSPTDAQSIDTQRQSESTGRRLANLITNNLATGNELTDESNETTKQGLQNSREETPASGQQQEEILAALAQPDVSTSEHPPTTNAPDDFNTIQMDANQQETTRQATSQQDTSQQDMSQQGITTARLVVDLSDRQLTFYKQEQRVKTYSIAVGKVGWETPLGEFTVTDMDPEPLWQHPLTGELVPAGADSPLGSRWIGFWSDGIHRIGFHGTNQAQSIGQAISHGCIRLHDADIQELYSQIPLGTAVIVQP